MAGADPKNYRNGGGDGSGLSVSVVVVVVVVVVDAVLVVGTTPANSLPLSHESGAGSGL